MKKSIIIFFSFFLLFLWERQSLATQTPPPEPTIRILFIFDASQSMLAHWQTGKKIEGAKRLLGQMVDSLKSNPEVQLALRVYGHQSVLRSSFSKDCKDTKLEVPFSPNNHVKIKNKIESIVPKGTTPIALSLEQSANDFPQCSNCKNIIILITDGIEECGGDPCAISQALQKNKIVLKPFIIGVGLGQELIKEFECMGKYVDASNEESFYSILETVVSEAITASTIQFDLLDTGKKPSETNVVMSLTDKSTGAIRYNYVHTLNHKGLPDTLAIDPDIEYAMTVFTLPAVKKDNIRLAKGKHTTIKTDAPQGSLLFKITGYNEYKNLEAVIRLPGKNEILNVQSINNSQKYLTGKYDVEILTLPRIYLKGVEVKQSHTTAIDIPQPGIASVTLPASGFASVYLEEKGGLKWLTNLEENKTRIMLPLQPGLYKIVYRSVNSKESVYTIEQSFKIEAGSSVSVHLK